MGVNGDTQGEFMGSGEKSSEDGALRNSDK